MRILRIEDDVRLRKALQEGFRDLGDEVVVASHADVALARPHGFERIRT